MDNKKRKLSETELLRHSDPALFKKIFGDDFADKLDFYVEEREFFYGPFMSCIKEVKPLLVRLAKEQYPRLQASSHPNILKWIDLNAESIPTGLIRLCRKLCKQHKEGEDMRKFYPQLDEWREYYCKPQEPKLMTDSSRNPYVDKDDDEWEAYKAKENESMRKYHKECEQRYQAFYTAVQPALFKYQPCMEDVDEEHMVLFAVGVRDEYENWKVVCEDIDITVEYNMPAESLDLPQKEWQQLYSEYAKKKETKG